LREAHPAFVERGAQVIAVGTGAVFQARRLMQDGMPFPCLVDETAGLHRALGIGRVSWRAVLSATTYGNYWRAWRRGARPGMVTGDPRRLSGVAIFDAIGRLRWIHRSRTIGDYPAVPTVLAELDRFRDDAA
jgi:AhpC/TSA antioxidant enzyme